MLSGRFLKIMVVMAGYFLGPAVFAQAFFVDPRIAVGSNPAQGTFYLAGLDLGIGLSENLAVGVHSYYSAGETPQHDREVGGGGFLVFAQPLAPIVVAQLRQELNYVDQRDRFVTYSGSQKNYSHTSDTGAASVTSAGLHVQITPGLRVSAGYRMVLGLTHDDVGHKRSGTFFGLSIGI